MFEDTICAPATPPVNSSLAVIRLSGPETLGIARAVFSSPDKLDPRRASHGQISENNEIIDDVVMIYYRSPGSFTGEDMAEIFCHGNPLVVRRIIDLLKKHGARMAGPGEFSKRAFLNGKMDLTEAEAINHIVMGTSQWEVSSAIKQMHGSLRGVINEIRDEIIELKADIEALIDFAEDDIEFISYKDAGAGLRGIKGRLEDILRRCRLGERISHGIDLPIVGRPNVGKSSIMNLILNAERAIISDIPGTTRDLINESVMFAGLRVNIIDTAGIAEPGCEIEEKGMSLARKKIVTSPVVIMVLDITTGITQQDRAILELLNGKKRVILANKIDLARGSEAPDMEAALACRVIPFSAKTGEGLNRLEEEISAIVHNEFVDYENCFVADIRVIDLLEAAIADIERCDQLFSQGEPPEIAAVELQALINTIKEITGEISPDDVLNSIFARFCIGK